MHSCIDSLYPWIGFIEVKGILLYGLQKGIFYEDPLMYLLLHSFKSITPIIYSQANVIELNIV